MGVSYGFWKSRKVFITGHTGFKGSWLTTWLHVLGAEVHGFSRDYPSVPAMFKEIHSDEFCTHNIGDIRSLEDLKNSLVSSNAEILFHLAAQPLVRASYRDPIDTYSTNLMGTINVLEAARHSKQLKCMVIITTDKCYENREWPWGYREVDRLGGFDPYSSSKACAEIATAAWRRSYFKEINLAVASARAGNVIGGGDWAEDRIIPDIIRSIDQGREPVIRNPKATRPWQHVLEPLSGYLMLAEALIKKPDLAADAWNFGPNESSVREVSWITDRTCHGYGNGRWSVEPQKQHFHEANLLSLDSSKSKQLLSWHPKWNVEVALEKTVSWYKHFRDDRASIRDYTLKQINEYMLD